MTKKYKNMLLRWQLWEVSLTLSALLEHYGKDAGYGSNDAAQGSNDKAEG